MPTAAHRLRSLRQHLQPTTRATSPAATYVHDQHGAVNGSACSCSSTGIQAGGSRLGNLLVEFQDKLGDRVELSLVPSTPAAPLVAGHTLFHPADMAKWMKRWTASRPEDGEPLRMLMAPSDEPFKGAPLIIEPASGAPADSASLSAWCEKHRQTLEAATDVCGALLFRGWGLDEIDDYEACMRGLGMRTSDFVGTAPRAKVGKYIVQNVSFESPSSGPSEPQPMDQFRHSAEVVWAENNTQFFNFHNELAYMDAEHHEALGFANYACFCCAQPSTIGGYTLVADARRVYKKIQQLLGKDMPAEFKFVIARKSLAANIPKKDTGDYEDFLCGNWEFSNYPDQWSPNFETRLEDIRARCAQLGIEASVDEERNDVAITSGWVPFTRQHKRTGEETVWCNINHAVLGRDHELLPFWFRDAKGLQRRPSWEELFAIFAAYWSETTFFTWERGDMLLLHNQLVAHNATPGLEPSEIMTVAAHNYDLAAARAVGFRAAPVAGPNEFGNRNVSSTPGKTDSATDIVADPECEFAATDFHHLARQLKGDWRESWELAATSKL